MGALYLCFGQVTEYRRKIQHNVQMFMHKKFGIVPKLVRAISNSPATLYVSFGPFNGQVVSVRYHDDIRRFLREQLVAVLFLIITAVCLAYFYKLPNICYCFLVAGAFGCEQ